ncbi:MAG: DUF4870 domain-containing protein [Cyanobacteria bacterium J06623_4]
MGDASLTLFENGSLAFEQARYNEAITCLERFCQETVNRKSKRFFQAQMWLIQAYHKDHQNAHAIALCEQLTKSDIPQVKKWADKALKKLMNSAPSHASCAPDTRLAASLQTASPQTLHTNDYQSPNEQNTYSSDASAAPHRTTSHHTTTHRTTPHHTTSKPRHTTNHRARHTSKVKAKDYTDQLLSACAHGSISVLASILLFILFNNSLTANILGLVRFAVPLLIFLNTDSKVAKANAKEALNYAITCLVLIVPFILAFIFLMFSIVAIPPLGILLALTLGIYSLILSLYPVVVTILCLIKEDTVVRYPEWLILHLV